MEILVGLGIIALFIVFGLQREKKPLQEKNEEAEAQKKLFKLFNGEGTLIKEYRDVYVTHWDKNIYYLCHEYRGKHCIRIDKGEDMLLIIENMPERDDL